MPTDTPITDRLTELGVAVEALRQTDGWLGWLNTARHFHSYSLQNQILIWCQRPQATHVAGYRAWQAMGRQVLKGEKGIRILAPMRFKEDADDGTQVTRIRGFKAVPVFDIAQTDGNPLPAPPPWPMLDGDYPYEDFRARMERATGCTITTPAIDEGLRAARGWYQSAARRISIRDRVLEDDGTITTLPDAQRAKTLCHELGHHFDPGLTGSPRAEKELVAESVAWLVSAQLGLDSTEAVEHYLAGWGSTTEALLGVAGRVATAHQKLVAVLAFEPEPELVPA